MEGSTGTTDETWNPASDERSEIGMTDSQNPEETLKLKEAGAREQTQQKPLVQTEVAVPPKEEFPTKDQSNDLSLDDSKVVISAMDEDAQIKAKAANTSTKTPSQDFSSLSLNDTHTVIAAIEQDNESKEKIVKETVLEHQQRGASVPGAFGSQPTFVSNPNDADANTQDEESGVLVGQAAAESSEFLIKAELVDELSNDQKEEKLLVDAEVLEPEDPTIKQRRRRLSIAGIVAALIIIIVLAVTLSLRDDDNGGSGSSAQTFDGPTTIFASSSPTVSIAPSMEPSSAPSTSPSENPSQSPTRNTWELQQALYGIRPLEPGETPFGGARVGEFAHISDIAETPLSSRTGKDYMVAAAHGSGTVIAGSQGINFFPNAASIYLCDGELGLLSNDGIAAEPCELVAFLEGVNIIATALKGTFFVLHSQVQEELFDLSNIDLFNETIAYPSFLVESLFATGNQYDRVALNEEATRILALRSGEKLTVTLGGDPLGVESSTAQPSVFAGPHFFTMATTENISVTIIVTNENLPPPCQGGIACNNFFYDDQITIERRDLLSGEVDLPNEVDLGGSVWSRKGIAVNGNADIVAVSSANVQSAQTVDFQVDVFELANVNGTSVWEPMGSTLLSGIPNDFFGESLALNAEGTFLVVGAHEDTENGQDAGKVYSFVWDGSDWSLLEEPLKGASGSLFGTSLDLSPDGRFLAVGAPGGNENGDDSGEVLVYKIQGV